MTNSSVGVVSQVCQNTLARQTYNAHIFINSVTTIAQVIRQAQLKSEQVRIVCSTSGEADRKNREKLGPLFPISSTKDPVRKINFYTSTSFEGCDIYDPVGRTFIVSDGHAEHTLVDIPTTFRQVCGRLRDTRYSDQVVLIFSSSYTGNPVTVQEFAEQTWNSYRKAQNYCQLINRMSEQERELHNSLHVSTTLLNDNYIRERNGRLEVDRNRLNFEIVRFRLQNKVYTTRRNLRQELINNGIRLGR